MDRWYVARVQWGREHRVIERLDSMGYRGYSPPLLMDDDVVGQVFPTYTFVSFDVEDDGWQRINEDRDVVRLLPMHCPYPSHLPRGFVELVMRREDRGEFILRGVKGRLLLKYVPGDMVPIIRGPFTGLQARFVQQVRDNCEVLIRMLGVERPVTLPTRYVQGP